MHKFIKTKNFWGGERSQVIFLSILLAVVFLGPFVSDRYVAANVIVDVFLGLLLIMGLAACPAKRLVNLVNIIFVLATLIYLLLSNFYQQNNITHIIGSILTTTCLLLFIRVILFQVFKEGDVTTERILGAISVYLLLGLLWANFYELINLFDPLAFNFSAASTPPASHSKLQFLYFSFINLTTTGFGDIVPVSQAARTFSIAEALIGQLFPTILIGRLVSLLVTKNKN